MKMVTWKTGSIRGGWMKKITERISLKCIEDVLRILSAVINRWIRPHLCKTKTSASPHQTHRHQSSLHTTRSGESSTSVTFLPWNHQGLGGVGWSWCRTIICILGLGCLDGFATYYISNILEWALAHSGGAQDHLSEQDHPRSGEASGMLGWLKHKVLVLEEWSKCQQNYMRTRSLNSRVSPWSCPHCAKVPSVSFTCTFNQISVFKD